MSIILMSGFRFETRESGVQNGRKEKSNKVKVM